MLVFCLKNMATRFLRQNTSIDAHDGQVVSC